MDFWGERGHYKTPWPEVFVLSSGISLCSQSEGEANCAPHHGTLLKMGFPCCMERDPGLLSPVLRDLSSGEAVSL